MLEEFEWDRRKNYAPFGSPKMILELSLAILEAQPVPAGIDFTMNAPGGEATPSGDVAQKVAGAASAVACALGSPWHEDDHPPHGEEIGSSCRFTWRGHGQIAEGSGQSGLRFFDQLAGPMIVSDGLGKGGWRLQKPDT